MYSVENITNKCRLCLRDCTGEQLSLFYKENGVSFADRLLVYFCLEIHSDVPGWPTNACLTCIDQINGLIALKNRIRETHKILCNVTSTVFFNESIDRHSETAQNCEIFEPEFEEQKDALSDDDLIEYCSEGEELPEIKMRPKSIVLGDGEELTPEMVVLETHMYQMNLFVCQVCDKDKVTYNKLKTHLVNYHRIDEYFLCCDFSIFSKAPKELYRHIQEHVDYSPDNIDKYKEDSLEADRDDDRDLVIDTTSTTSTQHEPMGTLVIAEVSSGESSPTYDLIYSSEFPPNGNQLFHETVITTSINPENTKSVTEKSPEINSSTYKYETKSKFILNRLTKTNSIVWLRKDASPELLKLEDHIRKMQLFTCRVCNISTGNLWSLKQHVNNSHTRSYTICCNLPISCTPPQLYAHVKSHLKVLKCELCNKTFATQHNKNQHNKTNHPRSTNSKPHICDICGVRFVLQCSLKNHRLNHENVNCSYCGKVLNKQSSKTHIQLCRLKRKQIKISNGTRKTKKARK